MIYQIIIIVGVTLIVELLYRYRIISACPICAGVVAAWLVGLVGIYSGITWVDQLFTGLLMAGSVGALAEKYGGKNGLVWKSALVLAGFPAIYFLIDKNLILGVPLGTATLLLVFFGREKEMDKSKKGDIFENCCG